MIPLDELPHWLEICNWAPDIHMGMYPASMSYMQREGEYDVVCHHCAHGVDSLHQSVSEREAWSVPASNTTSSKHSEPQAVPKAQRSEAVAFPPVQKSAPNPLLGQPPFGTVLQAPFVGMCVVDMHTQYPSIPTDSSGQRRRMSIENSAPPPIFGVNVGSPPLSIASSCNACVVDSPRTDTPCPPHSYAGSFGKPQRVESLRNESVASMQSASVASTRSLTAAALQQLKRTRRRRLSRGSSLHTNTSATEAKSLSQVSTSKVSKVSKESKVSRVSKASMASKISSVRVISRHRRKVLMRRRRAEARKAPSPLLSTVTAEKPEPKPEQVNSATKRRDRRNRMMEKRRQSDRGKQPYLNMMRTPNWSPGMSKH